MKRNNGFIDSAMRHNQIVYLVIAVMIIVGGYALFNMPRQEFPVFTIRQGLVVGVYPGATSSQVEQQLTTEVERYLFGFNEIKKNKTYSHSRDGLMVIYVELNDNVKNADEFWSKLKHGLNNLKSQLPTGVVALIANNDFGDTSALLITIESDNASYRDLEGYLNQLEDRLRQIKSVSKLRHYGLQKEQISVYLDKNKLEKYSINSTSMLAALFTQGFTTSGGSINNKNIETPIHITSIYKTENDIAEQIIYTDPAGHTVRLKDVARIVREYPEPDSYILNNGKKCVLISMEMLEGNNIVEYGEEVNTVLHKFQKELPKGVSIERIADQPKVVGDSISTFMSELLFAILAVILVTMLLLPIRVASVAASSIPISIFISLAVMYIFGLELNTVTLAGLIVVLGMVVDNSVVIVDNYMEQLDHGISSWHASIISAKAYVKAIISATLAISITFFPFLFTLTGTFRDFVLLFPWTVTIALSISLLVATLVIPFLQFYFVKKGFSQTRKRNKFNILDAMQSTYEKFLAKAFAHPKTTIGIGGLSVILAIVLFIFVHQRLMPTAERNQFAVEIYLPQGSSLNQTSLVCDSLERLIKHDSRVLSVTSFIGTSSPRFHTTYAPNFPAKNYAQFIVNTESSKATISLLNEFSKKYSNYFANAYCRFKQLDYQPVAAPVEIRISGGSISDLKRAGDSIAAQIKNVNGITWVRNDFMEKLPVALVNLNNMEANRLGINKTNVATNLSIGFEGLPMTTLWENDYPVAVKLITDRQGSENIEDIKNENIHSYIPGVSVPLRQIATVTPGWEEGQIVRRNGVPTLTVLADIDRNYNITKVFPDVDKAVNNAALPDDVSIEYGGAHEIDNEYLPQLIAGLIISICIIFLILLIHFRKISLALLVLVSSSLSLFGAVLGVLVLNVEFGLTSILGIVSLIGILVRNGIIMLDYTEELRTKNKKSVLDSAMEAGKRRMRPIFLTSAAASMGVIPMIISGNPLWCPMGAVICFGTITSMVLLVFILPVAYWEIFKAGDKKRTAFLSLHKFGIKKRYATIALVLIGSFGIANAQKSITLDSCKILALQNNYKIKEASSEVEQSEQLKKSAFTNYFPKVSGSATLMKMDDYLVKYETPTTRIPVLDMTNAANPFTPYSLILPAMPINMLDYANVAVVSAIQPLFTGGRIYNGKKLADIGYTISKEKQSVTTTEVLVKTEELYWSLISLEEKLKTVDSYKQMLDTLQRDVTVLSESGIIQHTDLLKVQLKLNEIKVKHLRLTNGIQLSKMVLCQHIGIPYDSTLVFSSDVFIDENPQQYYVNASEAIKNRDEYQMLNQAVAAEKLQKKMLVGEYLPQLSVGAAGLYMDLGSASPEISIEGIDFNFSMNDKTTSAGMVFATLSVPISDWWGGSHKIKQSQAKIESAEYRLNETSELLVLQITQAKNELEENYFQMSIALKSVEQAKENLKVTTDNYMAGVVGMSDLLEAQSAYQSSMDSYTEALCNYQIKKVKYLQATNSY